MVETGHPTWAKSGSCNLSLIEAARLDVGEAVGLEKTLPRF